MACYEEILSSEDWIIKGNQRHQRWLSTVSLIIGDINRSGRDSLEKDRSISHSLDRISSFVPKKEEDRISSDRFVNSNQLITLIHTHKIRCQKFLSFFFFFLSALHEGLIDRHRT